MIKSLKLKRIALNNGKEALIKLGINAWEAYIYFIDHQNQDAYLKFADSMRQFYFDNGKMDTKDFVNLHYASIKSSRPRLAKQIKKELYKRNIDLDAMLRMYKVEIEETQYCYGY